MSEVANTLWVDIIRSVPSAFYYFAVGGFILRG